MAFRWIVNAGLVAIPVGTTLGVLFGIDAQRHSAGEAPLFTPDNSSSGGGGSGGENGGGGGDGNGGSTGGGGGSSGSVSNNGTVNSQYCQLEYGISPPSKGMNYTLNPNQWGVKNGVSGLCMNVTTFNNETYPSKYSAPEWSATWKYSPGPETQPVWAFPNIMVEDGLPVTLSNVSAIEFDLLWSYTIGNVQSTAMDDDAALENIALNANVAIDMFMDADAAKSKNSSAAEYEVMVWFGRFGAASYAIGNTTLGVVDTYNLNGTNFDLYYGTNSANQNVYTWVATTTTQRFTGDLLKLITELTAKSGPNYPALTDHLGSFSFGSEAYSANSNVTFYVPELSIDIQS